MVMITSDRVDPEDLVERMPDGWQAEYEGDNRRIVARYGPIALSPEIVISPRVDGLWEARLYAPNERRGPPEQRINGDSLRVVQWAAEKASGW